MKNKRKPQYRLICNISERDNKKIFIKSAATEDASGFLKNVIKKENFSKDFFGNKATVICGTLKDNCIYYPYLTYPTLEQMIIDHINHDDNHKFGIPLIEKYISFIHALPSKQCRPERFFQEFGIDSHNCGKSVNCLLLGPIDCIPANIFVNGNSWHIIDHEWTYEFPIPTDFIIYRGIYSLIIHLQELIQTYASMEQPITLLQGYGKNRTYVPLVWLELLHSMEIPIEKLKYYEYLFQKKVFIKNKPSRLRLKNPPQKIYEVKPIPSWILSLILILSMSKNLFVKLFREPHQG